MTEIWTIQIAKHRLAKTVGITLLDTTVKSGNPIFAPSWDMVLNHKRKLITDEEYTAKYLTYMRYSYTRHKEQWLEVLRLDKVAVACYCPKGVFCHRHLLTDYFLKVAKYHNLRVTFKGELS